MALNFIGGEVPTAKDAHGEARTDGGMGTIALMGGELHAAKDGQSPTFLVAALKEPLSENLDRIQIVKGWLGADGETHENTSPIWYTS